MKYFAKYLPVEEEIKGGDTYLDFTDNKVYVAKNWQKHINEDNEVKKVKLFLCTRDIKEGEELSCYVDVGEPPYEIEKGIALSYKQKDDTWTYQSDSNDFKTTVGAYYCFRVIGEISKDAIRVKEGDEFDEKNIEIHYIHRSFPDQSTFESLIEKDFHDHMKQYVKNGKYSEKVKIKCPCCNTFK